MYCFTLKNNQMAELHIPRAHSNEWYDQLSARQDGYYYPWQSEIGERNGEDAFRELVDAHLGNDKSVLEVGCGHGELALSLSSQAGNIVAYDRIKPWIDRANQTKAEQGVSNVEFLCHDAIAADSVTLPVPDNSVDLFICRRGPLHWIPDAPRAARPGAVILHLAPMEEPIPAWTSKLPHKMHYENCGRYSGAGSIHVSVDNRLHQAGLVLDSGWGFDVPERFVDPMELYKVVTWGLPESEVDPFEDLEHRFDRIYETYAEDYSGKPAIVLRHCRYLWKAVIR